MRPLGRWCFSVMKNPAVLPGHSGTGVGGLFLPQEHHLEVTAPWIFSLWQAVIFIFTVCQDIHHPNHRPQHKRAIVYLNRAGSILQVLLPGNRDMPLHNNSASSLPKGQEEKTGRIDLFSACILLPPQLYFFFLFVFWILWEPCSDPRAMLILWPHN